MPLDPSLDPFGGVNARSRTAQRLANIEEFARQASTRQGYAVQSGSYTPGGSHVPVPGTGFWLEVVPGCLLEVWARNMSSNIPSPGDTLTSLYVHRSPGISGNDLAPFQTGSGILFGGSFTTGQAGTLSLSLGTSPTPLPHSTVTPIYRIEAGGVYGTPSPIMFPYNGTFSGPVWCELGVSATSGVLVGGAALFVSVHGL